MGLLDGSAYYQKMQAQLPQDLEAKRLYDIDVNRRAGLLNLDDRRTALNQSNFNTTMDFLNQNAKANAQAGLFQGGMDLVGKILGAGYAYKYGGR